MLLGLFLLGGSIWVFPRWYLFVTDHRRRYLELRDLFLLGKGYATGINVPDEAKDEWVKYYQSNNVYYEDTVVFKPSPRENRDRILTWMSLWPISMICTGAHYLGVRFFQTVYYHISGYLQGISNSVFKGEVGDFQKEPAPKLIPENEETI
jgi:hypothetical protein